VLYDRRGYNPEKAASFATPHRNDIDSGIGGQSVGRQLSDAKLEHPTNSAVRPLNMVDLDMSGG
jgi:hypothetical protein